jgi:hypothetical protein
MMLGSVPIDIAHPVDAYAKPVLVQVISTIQIGIVVLPAQSIVVDTITRPVNPDPFFRKLLFLNALGSNWRHFSPAVKMQPIHPSDSSDREFPEVNQR